MVPSSKRQACWGHGPLKGKPFGKMVTAPCMCIDIYIYIFVIFILYLYMLHILFLTRFSALAQVLSRILVMILEQFFQTKVWSQVESARHGTSSVQPEQRTNKGCTYMCYTARCKHTLLLHSHISPNKTRKTNMFRDFLLSFLDDSRGANITKHLMVNGLARLMPMGCLTRASTSSSSSAVGPNRSTTRRV